VKGGKQGVWLEADVTVLKSEVKDCTTKGGGFLHGNTARQKPERKKETGNCQPPGRLPRKGKSVEKTLSQNFCFPGMESPRRHTGGPPEDHNQGSEERNNRGEWGRRQEKTGPRGPITTVQRTSAQKQGVTGERTPPNWGSEKRGAKHQLRGRGPATDNDQ